MAAVIINDKTTPSVKRQLMRCLFLTGVRPALNVLNR